MRRFILILLMLLPVYGSEDLTLGGDITIGGERYTLTVDGEVVEEESEEDIELSEEEVQQLSDAINTLQSNMEDIQEQDAPVAQVIGVNSSNVRLENGATQQPVEMTGVSLSSVITPSDNSVLVAEEAGNDVMRVYSAVSLTEEEMLGISKTVSPMSYTSLLTNESFELISSCSENEDDIIDPRANGANFGGGASGGGGTGVSGLNGKNQYQTLILDGSKNLNINKKYLKILYGNDTPYWDEDYSIPLVSFDIGTLIYNGITLDNTYELEHGLDYSEFINNVYFPTLDPEYVYRLELNNGAVFLWAKLPDTPPIPEPKIGTLILLATFFALNRKRA